MNVQQKRAWLEVVSAGLAALAFLILGLTVFILGLNFQIAFAGLAFLGLAGFTPFIGRGQKFDERDRAIERRAAFHGAMASYAAFFLCCFGSWVVNFAILGHEQISVHLVGDFVFVAMWSFIAAKGTSTLVLYNRHVEADQA